MSVAFCMLKSSLDLKADLLWCWHFHLGSLPSCDTPQMGFEVNNGMYYPNIRIISNTVRSKLRHLAMVLWRKCTPCQMRTSKVKYSNTCVRHSRNYYRRDEQLSFYEGTLLEIDLLRFVDPSKIPTQPRPDINSDNNTARIASVFAAYVNAARWLECVICSRTGH